MTDGLPAVGRTRRGRHFGAEVGVAAGRSGDGHAMLWIPFVTNNRPAEPKEVPDGWGFANLDSLAQVNPAQLASGTDPDYLLEYLDIGAIEQPGIIGASRTLRFADAPSRARRMVRKGDLLVSTVRPYLRNFARVRQASENLVASTGYAVIRPRDGADGRFLYRTSMQKSMVSLPFLVRHSMSSGESPG